MQQDNDFYKNVLDNLYDGVYFTREDRTISYWNKGAEKHTGYCETDVMGKRCTEVFNHVNDKGIRLCGASCPVSQTMADGCIREEEVFFPHKDGHMVPALLRVAPIRPATNQVVVAVELCSEHSPRSTILKRLHTLKQVALCDPLTGLANRRYLEMAIFSKLDQLRRYGWSFGILFVDLDHFKTINDTYGHGCGDKVLKMVSSTMRTSVRSFDVLGRWGGEEFIVILINVDVNNLLMISNRFRLLIQQSSFLSGSSSICATVSIGATLAAPDDTAETLVNRADQLMYQSKESGRNTVTLGLPATSPANQAILENFPIAGNDHPSPGGALS